MIERIYPRQKYQSWNRLLYYETDKEKGKSFSQSFSEKLYLFKLPSTCAARKLNYKIPLCRYHRQQPARSGNEMNIAIWLSGS